MRTTAAVIAGLGVAVLLGLYFWHEDPQKVGLAAAERDVAAGRLRIEVCGPPPAPWYLEYMRLLRQRHGIEVEFVAGCVVTESFVAKMDAYNERMVREIHSRFGAGVLETASRDARKTVGNEEP
jgi:hypothetical protein